MGEGLADVAHQAAAVVDVADTLAGRRRVHAPAPHSANGRVQLPAIATRNALHQQVQVQRTAALELDLYEPLDGRPLPSERRTELAKVAVGVDPGQVLASCEDHPEAW